MKAFVTIILFFLFAVAGIKIGNMDAASIAATMQVCIVQNAAEASKHALDEGTIVPLGGDKGLVADMEVTDGYNLAHRVSASAKRMYRFSSMETFQFMKALLRRMATRMANLASCHTRVYDTSRSLSWDTACEHYIFGMRRILI